MTPPDGKSLMPDDPVLIRLDNLREQVDVLNAKIDRLPDTYVTRREWDQGSAHQDSVIDDLRLTLREGPAGTRQNVALILSGIAIVVAALAVILR